jgi:hypothetical protein
MEQRIADLKAQGKEAFGKGDYLTAIYFYGLVNALNHLLYVLKSGLGLNMCWLVVSIRFVLRVLDLLNDGSLD